MQRQATLLLACLGRHKPHIGSGDCLTDRLGVNRIVLMPLHIGRHVGRRHQANGVAKRLQLARPMMRRGTGFDANQARRQLLEKRQNVAPLDLAAKHHIALRIDGVNLENRRVVFGRFTAKLLIGREFAWSCEPHLKAEHMAAPTSNAT